MADQAEKGHRLLREYVVEETITVVGVAHVMATTKAEVKRMIDDDEVEFFYNDGQDIRRGDGIKIRLSSPPGGFTVDGGQ